MNTPRGPGFIGADAVSPLAHRRLHAGDIAWVASGLKLGVVRIHPDGLVGVKFFCGQGDTFFEHYEQLRAGESVEFRGTTVALIECDPQAQPKRWIRISSDGDFNQPSGADD